MFTHQQTENHALLLTIVALQCTLCLILSLRLPSFGKGAFVVSKPFSFLSSLKKNPHANFSIWKTQYIKRLIRAIPIRGSG